MLGTQRGSGGSGRGGRSWPERAGERLEEMELTCGVRAHASVRGARMGSGWLAGPRGWAGWLGFGPVGWSVLFFFVLFFFLFLFSVFRFSNLNLILF